MKFNKPNKFQVGLLTLVALVAGLAHCFGWHDIVTPQVGMLAVTPVILPTNAKDIEGFRTFFGTLKQQFASTAEIYEGPIKALFDEVGAKLTAALEALPKTTDANWSVNDKLDQFFGLLACANNVVMTLGLELGKVKQNLASAVPDAIKAGTVFDAAGVEAAVTAKIAERTGETGDLAPKTLVAQLCSAAKLEGVTLGRSEKEAELAAAAAAETKAGERRTALTAAGVPLPPASVEAILKEADDKYNAAQETAKTRVKVLTEAGLALTPELLSSVWLGESEYKVFESTVRGIPALKREAKDEPLAGLISPAGSKGQKMVL